MVPSSEIMCMKRNSVPGCLNKEQQPCLQIIYHQFVSSKWQFDQKKTGSKILKAILEMIFFEVGFVTLIVSDVDLGNTLQNPIKLV